MSYWTVRRTPIRCCSSIHRKWRESRGLRASASWSCFGCWISKHVIKIIFFIIVIIIILSILSIWFFSIRELVFCWCASHITLFSFMVCVFHVFCNECDKSVGHMQGTYFYAWSVLPIVLSGTTKKSIMPKAVCSTVETLNIYIYWATNISLDSIALCNVCRMGY